MNYYVQDIVVNKSKWSLKNDLTKSDQLQIIHINLYSGLYPVDELFLHKIQLKCSQTFRAYGLFKIKSKCFEYSLF